MSLKNMVFSAAASSSTPEIQKVSTVDKLDPFMDNSGIALYQFNGNALDTGGVYNGTATNVTYGEGKFGQGAVFNGSNSLITTPIAQSNLTAAFSVSFFMYPSATSNYKGVFGLHTSAGNYGIAGVQWVNTSWDYSIYNGSTAYHILIPTTSIPLNLYTHIVCTYKANNYMEIYINGVLFQNEPIVGTLNPMGNIEIGRAFNEVGRYFLGKLDQFRVFNRALTQEEVELLYNEEKEIVSTEDNVDPFMDKSGIALYKLDGNALDTGGVYNGTATNVTYGEGKFEQCGVFNGNAYITLPNTSITNNLTISLWIKSSTLSEKYIFAMVGANYRPQFMVYTDTLGYLKVVLRNATATNTINLVTTNVPELNMYHHIVFMRQGTTLSLYLDGSFVSSNNTFELGTLTATHSTIGKYYDGVNSVSPFIGSIDQFRIFNRALTQEEVTALFEEKPYKFPIGIIPEENLVAFYPLDTDARDAFSTYEGTVSNVTFDGAKAVFNGSSSSISNTNLFNIITRNTYSISVWHFIPNGTTGTRAIIQVQDNNNTHYPLCEISYGLTDGKYLFSLRTNSASILYNQTVSFISGQWTHVVLMCTTGGAKAYLNGVEVASSSFTPVFTADSTGSFNIGRTSQDWIPWGGHYYNGSMGRVAIFNKALSQEEVTALYNEGQS